MATLVSERTDQPWLRRLYLPSYQVAEAAKYDWHHPADCCCVAQA